MAITAWTLGNVDLIASSTCRRHARELSGEIHSTLSNVENCTTACYVCRKAHKHGSCCVMRNRLMFPCVIDPNGAAVTGQCDRHERTRYFHGADHFA
jgi:hypothetical protein